MSENNERVFYLALGAAAAALLGLIWITGALSGLLFGNGWAAIPAGETLGVALRLSSHLGDPRLAWPAGAHASLPGAAGIYATLLLILAALVGLGLLASRQLRDFKLPSLWRRREKPPAAKWASERDLAPLRVRGPQPRRLTLGRSAGALLAAEEGHSVVVFGPTQTHKTSGLVVPALLEWQGPVLCTSVKSDVLNETLARREKLGKVWIFDPAQARGLPGAGASPLHDAESWSGALRLAHWIAGSAKGGAADLRDADFWFATAEKLLAPLLFTAANSGATMGEIVKWLDWGPKKCETEVRERLRRIAVEKRGRTLWEIRTEKEKKEREKQGEGAAEAETDTPGRPEDAEEDEGKAEEEEDEVDDTEAGVARRAYMATQNREERQRSSVYTTAETILAAFADPRVVEATSEADYTPERLLDGAPNTLYMISPNREQDRLRTVFSTLIQQLLWVVEQRASKRGGPIEPSLLLLLDECANIAPFPGLDETASTAAGLGVQLVTIFQDMAQIHARFGRRAETIVNNHRAKLIGNGISDLATLSFASKLIGAGEFEQRSVSTSSGEHSRRSHTEGDTYRELAPSHFVRERQPATGILVYGHLPPTTIELRPWFEEDSLRELGGAEGDGAAAPWRKGLPGIVMGEDWRWQDAGAEPERQGALWAIVWNRTLGEVFAAEIVGEDEIGEVLLLGIVPPGPLRSKRSPVQQAIERARKMPQGGVMRVAEIVRKLAEDSARRRGARR
jgi:type IV secretion system protein VirD4